jgi:hypothetical protein
MRFCPWSENRRLRKKIAEALDKAWKAEHWNEPEQADPYAEPFCWMTYPVELPAGTVVEKATLSGPPWNLRLTIKYPGGGKP